MVSKQICDFKGEEHTKKKRMIVVFIRTTPPVEPVKLVHHMLTDLNKTQLKTTRYISRYLPVEKTCQAHIEDIENSAKQIFGPHFSQKNSEGELISRRVTCRQKKYKLIF